MSAKPFSRFEWMIAWRYLRARRSEGGVSVMTWISLIGIMLAVFALIAVLAVRTGFRTDLTATILGANAHVSVYRPPYENDDGQIVRTFAEYEAMSERLAAVDCVLRAAPIVKGQVMATANNRNAGVQVFGEMLADLQTLPLLADPEMRIGKLDNFNDGVAIGSGIARTLGLSLGDKITLISPDGLQTPFGTSPRINAYDVVYIFSVGRYDIDSTRVYMPLSEAQVYFNREGVVDEFEILVEKPDEVESYARELQAAADERSAIWTWRDSNGGWLRALKMEDNVMFILMSVLVLIASMNIISGLIMLVKNKGKDIGILRTMGLSQGSIMRVFFICGASVGVIGTIAGVVLGCLFVIYIDPIFDFVNYVSGGGVWDPSTRLLTNFPAELRMMDVVKATALSLSLSFIVTIFPARRAAKLNPVEALRYE